MKYAIGEQTQDTSIFLSRAREKDRQNAITEKSSVFIFVHLFLSFLFFLISRPASRFFSADEWRIDAAKRAFRFHSRRATIPSVCRIDLINQHQTEGSRMSGAGQPVSHTPTRLNLLLLRSWLDSIDAYLHVGVWLRVYAEIGVKLFKIGHGCSVNESISRDEFAVDEFQETISQWALEDQ